MQASEPALLLPWQDATTARPISTPSAVGSATATRDANMSLFQRLNAEKGLQLPVFGTPVLGAQVADHFSSHVPECILDVQLNAF